MTPLPAVRTAMAGAGGGRRSAGATPRVTRSGSLRSVDSEPRGGRSPRDPRDRRPDFERRRRSPRLQSQKENGPSPTCAPSPVCAAPSPTRAAPSPPPSPLPSPLPRVRRSYSRLEGGAGGLSPRGGLPLSPLPLNVPLPPPEPLPPPQIPPLGLPGIGPAPPERRRKRKVTPIDVSELEAWAASMNALFEEAERFHLVVE